MPASTIRKHNRAPLRVLLGHLARPLLIALALAVLLTLNPYRLRGQEAYTGAIDQVAVGADAESATAFVSIVDADGQPVAGVTGFTASVDGVGAPVTSVTSVVNEENGVAALLVMDVSGSMNGEPLDQAKAAAAAFVQGLLEPDFVGLMTFGPEVSENRDYTQDRQDVVDAIEGLQVVPAPGTALHDAVVRSLEIGSAAPLPRRALLLLTDGQDSGGVSQRTREEALDAAAAGGVPIFAVALGGEADFSLLQELSTTAGGKFFVAPGPADVPAIFDAIANALRSQYVVDFDLPASDALDRSLTVSFQIAGVQYTTSSTFRSTPTVIGSDGGGGISMALIVLIVVAGGVLLAGAAFLLRRRRRRFKPPEGVLLGRGEGEIPLPQHGHVETASEGRARLTVIAGPNAGLAVSLGSRPIDVGSDASCALRLDGTNGAVASTHARVWLQNRRLMLHHVASRHQTLVGQKAVEWATLEPNDTIEIGPHIITFSLEE
jgi:hypothetical protein